MINGLRQCVALLTLYPLSLSRTSPSLCNYAPFITRWRHCCVRFLFIIIIPLDCNPHDVTTTLRVPLSRYPLPCTKHSPLCVPCRRRSGKCVKNVCQHFSVIQTLLLPLLSCFLMTSARRSRSKSKLSWIKSTKVQFSSDVYGLYINS